MRMPKLIMLVGIPGAGKTTYAKEVVQEVGSDILHVSSDGIRKELRPDDDWYHPEDNGKVYEIMFKRTLDALANGKDVIYDATNVSRKDRASIIHQCPRYVKIECHIIWAPIETCIERDATREHPVGKEAIDKMLKRFQAPFYDEGIAEIKIVRPADFLFGRYEEECRLAMHIPHDNPHHKLSIFEHCLEASKFMICSPYDWALHFAAYWHDMGKPYTKAFVNSRGEPCEIAHFYQHHAVGSWMSYGLSDTTPYTAWLISTHMDVFFANTKYYNNLPPFLKNKIDILHEADLAAH